jgi:hypothetical protein
MLTRVPVEAVRAYSRVEALMVVHLLGQVPMVRVSMGSLTCSPVEELMVLTLFVKPLSPCNRFMIAKDSPNGIVETGLPIRLAEKSTENVPTPNFTS